MTRTHKSHIHFNIKDPTKFGHQHDIAHLSNCPDPNCNDKYTGETARRVPERIADHSGRDNKLHLFKPANEQENKNEERQYF